MLTKIRGKKFYFAILAFLAGLFSGINITLLASSTDASYKYLDYFHKAYQTINTEYVDVPAGKELFLGAIQGMIKSLDDPYSRYLDEKGYADLRELTTGKFLGVGVEIVEYEEEIMVVSPIDESPAMKAGIMPGDIITRVNDKPIKGKKVSEVATMIKGKSGSRVSLHVKRDGFEELLEFEMDLAPVKINSIEYTIIKESNIGYIKIKNFGQDTAKDVANAVKEINSKKIDRLIIDLRYDPGGLLTAAISLSELFLKKGETIVSTKGRPGSGIEQIHKSSTDPVYNGKLIVLVNKGSASASEIFAGAIRDNKRGKLIGEKTFGKGSVQNNYRLDENIGLMLTIAKYYTPSGDMIHKKGIIPDYEVPAESISKDEIGFIRLIDKNNLLEKFVKKDTVYDDSSKKAFKEYLKQNSIQLSERTSNYILKNRINQLHKKPVYDIEFDNQLVSAIAKISEK